MHRGEIRRRLRTFQRSLTKWRMSKRCTRQIRTQDPMICNPTHSPLDQWLQLLNRQKIFAIYALTLLIYTVANANECNSIITSAMRGEMLTPNPNKCNSTLTSRTSIQRNLSPVQKRFILEKSKEWEFFFMNSLRTLSYCGLITYINNQMHEDAAQTVKLW